MNIIPKTPNCYGSIAKQSPPVSAKHIADNCTTNSTPYSTRCYQTEQLSSKRILMTVTNPSQAVDSPSISIEISDAPPNFVALSVPLVVTFLFAVFVIGIVTILYRAEEYNESQGEV